jgi:hypothetical protein
MRRPLAFVAGTLAILIVLCLIWFVLMVDRTMEHGNRMAVEGELFDAANGPGGPNYVREIEIYRTSLPDGDDRRLSIAAATISACKAKQPPCVAEPAATRAAARAELEKLFRESRDTNVRTDASRWLKN